VSLYRVHYGPSVYLNLNRASIVFHLCYLLWQSFSNECIIYNGTYLTLILTLTIMLTLLTLTVTVTDNPNPTNLLTLLTLLLSTAVNKAPVCKRLPLLFRFDLICIASCCLPRLLGEYKDLKTRNGKFALTVHYLLYSGGFCRGRGCCAHCVPYDRSDH